MNSLLLQMRLLNNVMVVSNGTVGIDSARQVEGVISLSSLAYKGPPSEKSRRVAVRNQLRLTGATVAGTSSGSRDSQV